jgi:hypothetical protein
MSKNALLVSPFVCHVTNWTCDKAVIDSGEVDSIFHVPLSVFLATEHHSFSDKLCAAILFVASPALLKCFKFVVCSGGVVSLSGFIRSTTRPRDFPIRLKSGE